MDEKKELTEVVARMLVWVDHLIEDKIIDNDELLAQMYKLKREEK